jgi:peptidoglycan L-alanyl-D-glutamate endopeptidase CwlK
MIILSQNSLNKLATVHPDMQKVVNAAALASPVQLVVMQGLRTREEELELWLSCHNVDGTRNGKPWLTDCNGTPIGQESPDGYAGTGVSRHQTGHAVDLGVELSGVMVWGMSYYKQLADLMLATAAKLDIPIIWGGTFLTPDNDHYELNENFYKGD